MKNYNDKLALGYFDHDGKLHKVEKLDRIPEIKGIISDEVQSPIPEYHEPPEFSMTVECSEDFARELWDQMRKVDEMILEAYGEIITATQCCLDAVRPQCHICPWKDKPQCKYHLMHSIMDIIQSHRKLVADAIEEKWKNDGPGSLPSH